MTDYEVVCDCFFSQRLLFPSDSHRGRFSLHVHVSVMASITATPPSCPLSIDKAMSQPKTSPYTLYRDTPIPTSPHEPETYPRPTSLQLIAGNTGRPPSYFYLADEEARRAIRLRDEINEERRRRRGWRGRLGAWWRERRRRFREAADVSGEWMWDER